MSKTDKTCSTEDKKLIADSATLKKAVEIVQNIGDKSVSASDLKVLGQAQAVMAEKSKERGVYPSHAADAALLGTAATTLATALQNKDLIAMKGTLSDIKQLSADLTRDVRYTSSACAKPTGHGR